MGICAHIPATSPATRGGCLQITALPPHCLQQRAHCPSAFWGFGRFGCFALCHIPVACNFKYGALSPFLALFIHPANEARQARSARALWHCPEATPKLELARPQAPLPASADSPQGTQGGHAVQVDVLGQRRRTGASDIMPDSQG